jgi:hypothetical protein
MRIERSRQMRERRGRLRALSSSCQEETAKESQTQFVMERASGVA